MTGPIRVVAALRAQPGKGAELLELWPSLAEQVRAEDGCLAYDLHRVAGDDDRFVVLERWASLDALEAHRVAPHMKSFGRSAAGLMGGAPEVTVLEDVPAV